jgi:hypothetical protein
VAACAVGAALAVVTTVAIVFANWALLSGSRRFGAAGAVGAALAIVTTITVVFANGAHHTVTVTEERGV